MKKKSPYQKKNPPLSYLDSEVSVSEDDGFIYVEALLSGIADNEVKMSFNKGILLIQANEKEKKIFYRVAIPGFFDETTPPKATCKKGILKVVFTKNKNTFIKK